LRCRVKRDAKASFLLADNKFAERAAWDREMLVAELQELSVVLPSLDPDIAITGFEAGEIEILFAEADNEKAQPEDWIPPMSVASPRGLVTYGSSAGTEFHAETLAMRATTPASFRTNARQRFSPIPLTTFL
jgi:hypothetical protein